jgi:hypothetical protein
MKTYDAHKNTTEVRQGSRRLMNFRVLLFSVGAIIVAFLIILYVFNLMAPGDVAP